MNSFGFGGANAHVLVESWVDERASRIDGTEHLPVPLMLTAKTEAALKALAASTSDWLDAGGDAYTLAYTHALRRDPLEKRLGILAQDGSSLSKALAGFANGQRSYGLVEEDALPESGGIAFIYAGNGSQWAGMGQLLLAESEHFASVIDSLDGEIMAQAGFSIREALATGDPSQFSDTAIAQPLLFAVQVAITELLRAEGIIPESVAGHSVGEVAAAWASGALTRAEAVRVICARSAAQAKTRGAGRMAAVSTSEADMCQILSENALVRLAVAGINSPHNLTLSGPLEDLEQLAVVLKKRGIAYRLLDLDYAFHSAAMDPVKESLACSLAGLAPVAGDSPCRFVSTVTGDVLADPLGPDYWWDNVRQPVHFHEAIVRMAASGARVFVEIGPHAILQRYLRESLAEPAPRARILGSLKKNDDGLDRLQELCLRLHLLSDGRTLTKAFPVVAPHADLPAYPWQRERHWVPRSSEGYQLIERQREHPLLGWRLKEAPAAWENVLDPRLQTWLADHQVGKAIVLPGAAYVEMAIAAAHYFYGTKGCEIEEIDIVAPVVFEPDHGRSLRFELNVRDGGFLIRSRQRLSDDDWVLNASGRLLGEVAAPSPAMPITLTDDRIVLDRDTHYHLAHCLGLDYGTIFQGLASAHHDAHCLEGQFSAEVQSLAKAVEWALHPALLDVCFQSLIAFFREAIVSISVQF